MGNVAAVRSVLLAAVLFGTTGTAQALGPDDTTPLGVGAARVIVGGVGLLAVLPLLGFRPLRAAALWRTPAGLTAGACTALYQVCFFASVRQAGVGLGTLVTIGSGPVFAGLLAWALLASRPGRTWVVATALCLAGLALLSINGMTGADRWGVLLALASGLAYAAYTVGAKRLMDNGVPSEEVMAAAFGLGGIMLLPILLTQPLHWLGNAHGAALALYLGLVTTTVAYALFGHGLARLAAGPVTTLVLAEPLVAMLLATLVLGEALTPASVAGALLVLAGLVLQGVASSRLRVPPRVPSKTRSKAGELR